MLNLFSYNFRVTFSNSARAWNGMCEIQEWNMSNSGMAPILKQEKPYHFTYHL